MKSDSVLPKVVTATNHPGAVVTQFRIRDHEITCDEQPVYGGVDSGPDPYDLIMAGVGGCTAISLRQYADRKGWEIGEVGITLAYDKSDDEDVFTKEISFGADLTVQQRAELLRVANCNTERMLARGITFTNALTPRSPDATEK